jgi:hypothetical protein
MATSLSPKELDLASLNLTNQPPEMKFVDNNGSVHVCWYTILSFISLRRIRKVLFIISVDLKTGIEKNVGLH